MKVIPLTLLVLALVIDAAAQKAAPDWVQAVEDAGWQPRDSAGELVYRDRMWILGGWFQSFEAPPCDVWSSPDGKTWTRITETAPWLHSDLPMTLVFDDKMWIMGGWYNGRLPGYSASNQVWWSTDGAKWEQATPNAGWSPRIASALVEFQGKMWLLGGTENYYFGDASSLKNDVWSSADGLYWELVTADAGWAPRAYHQAAVLDGKIYVFGGGNYVPEYFALNDVWCSADGKTWTRVTEEAPWHPRIWFSSAVYRNCMWVLGGWSNNPSQNWGDAWYSKDGAAWTKLESDVIWKARHEHSAFVFQDKLWVAGGHAQPLNSEVWSLEIPETEPFSGKPYTDGDLRADTWVATDALGRSQPGLAEAGPAKKDKWVGIFYWTWHVPRGTGGPNDNTKLIATARDGKVNWPENGCPHHWGEPELGYYMMTDPFVIRKHASMLADAGVDVVLFDTTNPPFTWKDEYEALCREYTEMREEGNKTPYIGFICPFWDPTEVINRAWQDLYQPGLWSDLWFRWDGKPFILANKDFVKDPEMLEFFTFRRPMPDYWLGPDGPDQWSWLEVYPQHVFRNSKGEAEQMSVGVAQNALPNTPGPAPMAHKRGAMGRSWHNGAKDTREGAVELGLNFDEQWRRAMEVDPKFIFVTGWNEWVAGRYTEWSKYTDGDCYFPGGLFVDQYSHEYSRDCEPMAGGHTDNYYYQLASWIRRFKGVRPMPLAKGPQAITIDGRFDDWATVELEFRDTIGDVTHREHTGYGGIIHRNDTGRNDFVLSKAAYDDTHLYFFVQTAHLITAHTDPMWMMLLLDADQDAATGWLGYDFVVNHEVRSEAETTVKRWNNGAWEAFGSVPYRVNGNGLELAVPRGLVGETGDAPAFDFHWADNIQSFDGIAELGVNGDSAPNRRWNYRFEVGG